MTQSKMVFPVEEAHLIVVALQPIHIQTHHTPITSLVEEHLNRIHLTNSLPSGGQSESMSKFVYPSHSTQFICLLNILLTQSSSQICQEFPACR